MEGWNHFDKELTLEEIEGDETTKEKDASQKQQSILDAPLPVAKVNKLREYRGGPTIFRTYQILTMPFPDMMHTTRAVRVADAICKEEVQQVREAYQKSGEELHDDKIMLTVFRLYFHDDEHLPFQVRKKTTRGYFTHISYREAKHYMEKTCFIEYPVEQPDPSKKWRRKSRREYDQKYERTKRKHKTINKGA